MIPTAWVSSTKVEEIFGLACENFHNPLGSGVNLLAPILLLAFVALLAAAGMVALPHLVGPRRETLVKQMPYESGMDPVGDARGRFDVRFYLVAIVFLIFDVELLFLYPWAVAAWNDAGLPAVEQHSSGATNFVFLEILIFTLLLAVAYVYAWRRGVFRWR
jgi:NADH:ubiquinone oxidoreductase subunit 3 (subunit A)